MGSPGPTQRATMHAKIDIAARDHAANYAAMQLAVRRYIQGPMMEMTSRIVRQLFITMLLLPLRFIYRLPQFLMGAVHVTACRGLDFRGLRVRQDVQEASTSRRTARYSTSSCDSAAVIRVLA